LLCGVVDTCLSNVTAFWVDKNALGIPGDQRTALLGVPFTENSAQVLLQQVFNHVRIGRHRL
jgi:hypothetical protein